MKITKTINGNITIYLYNGVKKYEHYKDSDGFEWWLEYDKDGNGIHYKDFDGFERWSEYDKDGNEIHFKDSDGFEWWSDDNPNNPNNSIEISEEEVKPFVFEE